MQKVNKTKKLKVGKLVPFYSIIAIAGTILFPIRNY